MFADRAKRWIYAGLGCLAVALGFIGAFVPGMPTTVFLLIASYCFARSSERLERWLLSHRRFGPALRRFKEKRGMPRSAKRAALGSMWLAITISSTILAATYPKAVWAVVLLGLFGTWAILYAVRTVEESG